MAAISLNQARDRMSTIRSKLNNEADTIRAQRSLSDTGRKLALAKALRDSRKNAAALREEFTAENRARRLELEKRLFGIPTGGDAASYRDAVDRAEKLLSAEQAEQMLSRAQRSGDDLLARAVADRAHSHGWKSVVHTYADNAGMSTALEQLNEVRSGESGLGVAAVFGVAAPAELRGLTNDWQVDDYITNAERQLVQEPTAPPRAPFAVF